MSVNINQKNGNLLASTVSNDGVAALIVTGVVPSGYTAGTEKTYYSLAEAEADGFTETHDTDNTMTVWEHIKDFYNEAGNGAELHFVMFANTLTLDDLVNKSNSYLKTVLVNNAGRIKLAAVAVNPTGAAPTYSGELDPIVQTAVATAESLADEEKGLNRPVDIIIEGRGFQGDAAALTDNRANNATHVGVALLADTTVSALSYPRTDYAAVGVVLGKLAALPVQRKISRVKDGAIQGKDWGLSGANSLTSISDTAKNTIRDKGYLLVDSIPGLTGFYFKGDPNSALTTNDYNSISLQRTMNKIQRIAYQVYVTELDEEIEIETSGVISTGQAKYLQSLVEKQLQIDMVDNGELSSVSVVVDPTQNVISTNKVVIQVYAIPKGYSSTIQVDLNFVPSNAE